MSSDEIGRKRYGINLAAFCCSLFALGLSGFAFLVSEKGLKIQSQNFELTQRPWVGPAGKLYEVHFSPDFIILKVFVQNYGNIPARKLKIKDKKSIDGNAFSREPYSPGSLFPNSVSFTAFRFEPKDMRRDADLTMTRHIEYQGAGEKVFRTRFAFGLNKSVISKYLEYVEMYSKDRNNPEVEKHFNFLSKADWLRLAETVIID